MANLNKQAKEILNIAAEYGVESNFFFTTTFERYLEQLRQLKQLKKSIKSDGPIITKEYVKGRENVYTNPAIKEYTNITNSANKTATTLMKIIMTLRKEETSGEGRDELMDAINGVEADE